MSRVCFHAPVLLLDSRFPVSRPVAQDNCSVAHCYIYMCSETQLLSEKPACKALQLTSLVDILGLLENVQVKQNML